MFENRTLIMFYLWTRIAWSCNLSKFRQETAMHSCSCFGGQSLRPSRPSQTSVRSWSIRRKDSSQTSNTKGIRSLKEGPLPTGAVNAKVCFGPHTSPAKCSDFCYEYTRKCTLLWVIRKWIKTTGGYLLASEKMSLLYYSQLAQERQHPRLGWLPVWLEARGQGGQKTGDG
jgi:hypothetical protein